VPKSVATYSGLGVVVIGVAGGWIVADRGQRPPLPPGSGWTALAAEPPILRYIQGRGVLASIGQHVGELGRQPC